MTDKMHSSVQDKGAVVDQLITFVGGIKKTIKGVKTDSIMSSDFTHFNTVDGRKVLINDKNVLSVEIFSRS